MAGQILVIVLLGIAIIQYILPWFKKINEAEARANMAITKYEDIKSNGISFSALSILFSSMTGKEEILKIMNSAPTEAEAALKKPEWTKEYLPWLKNVIQNSEEDKNRLMQAKQKLNSILPTLSPISNNIDEENITLKEYIRYMESIFIKQYGVNPNITLGLQGIVYGDGTDMPKNVGSLTLSIDFIGTNRSIQEMIDYINNSWDPEILNNTWVLSQTDIPTVMSNPLLSVESFVLNSPLDLKNIDEENSGRATIRLYVRGGSKEDVEFLKNAIQARRDILKQNIENSLKECTTESLVCSEAEKWTREEFAKKVNLVYTSLDESMQKMRWSDSIEILNLGLNSVRSLEDEFRTIVQSSNIPQKK